MSAWTVEPLTPANVDRAATYIAARDGSDAAVLAAQIRWRVFENPALPAGLEPGHLLVGDEGAVAGVNLGIAQRFRAGDRRLLGLCSSAFYVDAAARLQGFLMFRRLLAQRQVDLWLATTCNAESAALWERVGATPVDASRLECLLPLHATIGRLYASAGRKVELEYTDDWTALEGLATLLTPAGTLTASRDAAFLRWRYGQGLAEARHRVWLASLPGGECGWIALTQFGRRSALRLRCWVVTDLVWPADVSATAVIMAAAARLADHGDLLAVRGDAARALDGVRPFVVRRRFRHVPIWLKAADPALGCAGARIVPADGDTAP